MISKLKIRDPDRTPVPWWSKVPALKDAKAFGFQEGLTILWGPNGSGKSTILRALARLTHCEQGGVPKITEQSFGVFRHDFANDLVNDGMSLVSDGGLTFYFDPSASVGLDGGAFDYDFMREGLAQCVHVRKTSSGQQTSHNSGRVWDLALRMKDEDLDRRALQAMTKHRPQMGKVASQGLKKTSKTMGRRTVLLDEPERSLDIPTQRKYWHVFAHQTKFQIIAATHCPFALWIEGAMYIDLQPGYLNECRAEYKTLLQRIP